MIYDENGMTRKTRTVLFIICAMLFALASPSLIFYSQGYRVDWANKRIVQTGAFYLKALPKNADVHLDGKLEDETSGLTGAVLIEDLSPKIYTVEIRKGGYHYWQKTLEVRQREVTEAKNIILFPININFAVADRIPKITASATSSDGEKIVEFSDYEIGVRFLEDQTEPVQRKGGDRIFVTRLSEKIGNIFWLNNNYLIFNSGDKIKIAEIDDRDKINIIDLTEFPSPKVFWDKSAKKLYISSKNIFYVSDNLLP